MSDCYPEQDIPSDMKTPVSEEMTHTQAREVPLWLRKDSPSGKGIDGQENKQCSLSRGEIYNKV